MVPFCPFYFRVPLLKPNSKKKGTLIVMGLLGNLVWDLRYLRSWLRNSVLECIRVQCSRHLGLRLHGFGYRGSDPGFTGQPKPRYPENLHSQNRIPLKGPQGLL